MMGTQPGGPPDKTATLDAGAFIGTDDYNNAVTALYQQGFTFDYNVPGKNWSVFSGYPAQRETAKE